MPARSRTVEAGLWRQGCGGRAVEAGLQEDHMEKIKPRDITVWRLPGTVRWALLTYVTNDGVVLRKSFLNFGLREAKRLFIEQAYAWGAKDRVWPASVASESAGRIDAWASPLSVRRI
jgi:hypothetical protein